MVLVLGSLGTHLRMCQEWLPVDFTMFSSTLLILVMIMWHTGVKMMQQNTHPVLCVSGIKGILIPRVEGRFSSCSFLLGDVLSP